MDTNILVSVSKGGLDERFHCLLVQHVKSPGQMAQAHYRIAADLIVYMRGKFNADRLSARLVRRCKGDNERHELEFLRVVPLHRRINIIIGEPFEVTGSCRRR